MIHWPDRVRWFALTLPLAAVCWVVYSSLEWLFFVTRPSTLSALPFGTELAVLVGAPLPALWPLLALQALASGVALIAYPRLKAIAVVPAGVIVGALLLVLIDNFTYTLFGFGTLTSDGTWRLVYAALVPMLVLSAGARLLHVLDHGMRVKAPPAAAVTLVAAVVAAPLLTRDQPPPDVAAPPPARTGGPSTLPNVLIVGIDGVDATALSAYDYTRETTPYLRRLRDESLFFENAFSNVGRTHGSLVTLLTGRLPFSTHVTFPPTALVGADAHRHLPGLLKPLGYTSLQLGMRHYADAEDANLLGFDAANYRWQDLDAVSRTSDEDEATVFRRDVTERLDERFGHLFGWRHAIDVYAHVEGRIESSVLEG